MASKKTPTTPAAETAQQQLTLHVTADNAVSIAAATAADAQPALVEGWLAAKNVEAIAAVARDDAAPGPARKSARRAIAILKSRGVAIPDHAQVTRVALRPEVVVEARMTFPDAEGTQ
ncbi:MAG: hypothetical protein ACHREM_17975, partial [Polyangiales bacterium]